VYIRSQARRATEIDLHGVYHETNGLSIVSGPDLRSERKICHWLRFA
jgi:hypothetical protein